jgi:nitrite reductase/ring-hydroxylating ferredoxin subunit
MPEARRVTVAAVEEVPPGGVRIVSVDDRSVGIFNVGGTLYALANKCPHAGSPVCRGSVGGMSTADRPGGELRYGREGEILRCPWHGWEFDIASGRTITEPVKRIPTYPVFVEDGRIVLELKRAPRRPDAGR